MTYEEMRDEILSKKYMTIDKCRSYGVDINKDKEIELYNHILNAIKYYKLFKGAVEVDSIVMKDGTTLIPSDDFIVYQIPKPKEK